MKSKNAFAAVLLVLIMFACRKERHEVIYMNCHTFTDEAIINYADPAGDGCGWTITILQNPMPSPPVTLVVYSPIFLNPTFKVENLHVKITYKFDGNGFYCGIANTKLETISILKIQEL